MTNLVRFPRKSKPDTFTAYKVNQPKPAKQPSRINWDEFPLIALMGFVLISLAAAVTGGVGVAALVIAYKFGWWGLFAPVVLAAFVYACYWLGSKVTP